MPMSKPKQRRRRARFDPPATPNARFDTCAAAPRNSSRASSSSLRQIQEELDPARAIYAVVHSIPRGKVASYGQIAELAGIPNGHRIAARYMRRCPARLPWHRVVGKKDKRRAQINVRDPEHAA